MIYIEVIKKISAMALALLMAFAIAVCIMQSTGCKTQAVIENNEPYSCFCSRYLAREGVNSDTMTKECANAIKRDWCMKILKDSPDTFKDFNDCWRQ
jgi:hypothetical protein